MKKEIAAYFARCDTCSRVKADHLKPARLLHPSSILGSKWEEINMDFIVGLPLTQKGFDSIWVIVDRLMKSAHFIPVSSHYRPHQYVELYVTHIVCLHGVLSVFSDHRQVNLYLRVWLRWCARRIQGFILDRQNVPTSSLLLLVLPALGL